MLLFCCGAIMFDEIGDGRFNISSLSVNTFNPHSSSSSLFKPTDVKSLLVALKCRFVCPTLPLSRLSLPFSFVCCSNGKRTSSSSSRLLCKESTDLERDSIFGWLFSSFVLLLSTGKLLFTRGFSVFFIIVSLLLFSCKLFVFLLVLLSLLSLTKFKLKRSRRDWRDDFLGLDGE